MVHAEFGPNDNREDEPLYSGKPLINGKILNKTYRKCLFMSSDLLNTAVDLIEYNLKTIRNITFR